jgi:hypothetical protein
MKNTQKNIELIEARTLRNPEKPKCLNHDWQTPVAQNITKPTIYFLYFFLLSLSLSLPLSVSYTVALFTIIHGGTNIGHDAQIAKKRASHARIKIWISLFGSKISWHLSTPAENFLFIILFYFPRYRPPFGECCVCSSISFPFRDTSCACVGTCVRVCM